MPEEAPEIAEARRRGEPFVSYLDPHDRVQALSLEDTWERATIGRGPSADLGLPWDSEVSRVHAELIRVADDWTVVDACATATSFAAATPRCASTLPSSLPTTRRWRTPGRSEPPDIIGARRSRQPEVLIRRHRGAERSG